MRVFADIQNFALRAHCVHGIPTHAKRSMQNCNFLNLADCSFFDGLVLDYTQEWMSDRAAERKELKPQLLLVSVPWAVFENIMAMHMMQPPLFLEKKSTPNAL